MKSRALVFEMAPIDLNERLRRLLILVPEIVRLGTGMPVATLAKKLGIAVEDLPLHLERLMLVGKPPFGPDDLLEIYIENDHVHVTLHQSLDRPPRFTHDEALALAVGAGLLRTDDEESPTRASALDSALRKIEVALSTKEKHRYARLSRSIALPEGWTTTSEVSAALWKALRERRPLELVYYSAHRDRIGERRVEPYGVMSHRGYWYLVAGPDGRDGFKLYRVDRIRSARPIGEPNTVTKPANLDLDALCVGGFGRGLGDGPIARVEVSAKKSRSIEQRFPESQMERSDDGTLIISFEGVRDEWLSSFVIALGGAAKVIEPRSLNRKIIHDLRRARALYDRRFHE